MNNYFSDLVVLVSGAGSIGKRHLKNLNNLGIKQLSVCDPNEANLKSAVEKLDCKSYADLEAALKEQKPDIVFICSPTKFHITQALNAAKANMNLFIEKPLSINKEHIKELTQEVEERGLTCMVGCNMRFHHGPATVKRLLNEGRIGSVKQAYIYTGSYLPDWKPQQDYRQSYSADPEQGGAILDCIHEIDLALWYLGPATLVSTTSKPATDIDLPSVEGTADLVLWHGSGSESNVHLSFTEHEYKRYCIFNGTDGSITWDINKKKVDVQDVKGTLVDSYPEPEGYDINQMYIDEVNHFLSCIADRRSPQCNLMEATQALDIALKARIQSKMSKEK
ncbi:Gfo/Idh/MocA family oxidoreductase [Patescibacteria group bacterium]|nr:Gfo/Idh/MocA family oxidoreductase [Patescibacteria group bacterium]